MAITQFNDFEEEALDGLPWDAQLLYLRFLRRRMDYETGEVGRKPRVSWQALREVLHVEKKQGCANTGSPSRDRVKRAAKHLEAAGLIVMRSLQTEKHLIFFLPLADTDKSAQNKPARNPPDQPARVEAAPDNGSGDKPAHAESGKAAQHPIPVKNIRNGYISGTSIAREIEYDDQESDQEFFEHPPQQKASTGKAVGNEPGQHVQLAVFLRAQGVDVMPMNPLLSQWISDLQVTEQECAQAINICRKHLGPKTLIPYKYLDKVLRSQRAPSPERQSKAERRQATYEGLTGRKSTGESNVIDITAYTTQGR